jgi:hypothetical protein
MYIWRRAPRRLEFLPPWVTVLGETPTVGSKDRWGQGRQAPPAVATGGRSPSVVAHDGRTLPSRATTAASPLYKRVTAAAASPPSLL